jgi:serine/threonine-protein kinase
MGVVWRAVSTRTGERVAIKLLKGFDARARKRFVREVSVVRMLSHAGLVRVVDVLEDVEAGCPGLVMELLAGRTLADVLKQERRASVALALEIGATVADALAYLHRRGIVHRDVKPANLFLDQRRASVKLLDLGLAKLVGEAVETTRITRTGHAVGTPSYMAPEQLAGETDVDARADVWALGVTLYECLSGSVPYGGATLAAVLRSVRTGAVPSLRASFPAVPPGLDDAIRRMISPDRTARPSAAWLGSTFAELRSMIARDVATAAQR